MAHVIVTSIVGVPSEDVQLAWQGPGEYTVCFGDDECLWFDIIDQTELEYVLDQHPAYSAVEFVDESGFDIEQMVRE